MSRILTRWGGLFALCVLGWELASLLPSRVVLTTAAPKVLKGIIHVHSTYSDGGGTLDEIASDANRAGVDFVVLTDHNTTQPWRDKREGRYGNVDVFTEIEASVLAGHALHFYTHTEAVKETDYYITDLSDRQIRHESVPRDFFSVIAHPSNLKRPWAADPSPEIQGVEVFNFDSMWQRAIATRFHDFALTSALFPFNHYLGYLRFIHLFDRDASVWDGMNLRSHGHFGLLAPDTHSKFPIWDHPGIRWPSYEGTFRAGANFLFLSEPLDSDFSRRKRQIYSLIRAGRFAMAFHGIYPFEGNDWTVECPGKSYRSGDTFSPDPRCTSKVTLPSGLPFRTTVRLIRNGEVKAECVGSRQVEPWKLDEPGFYRVEVYVEARTSLGLLLSRTIPYVFYNPVYVR